MAEVQLNKPLYKSDSRPSSGTGGAPPSGGTPAQRQPLPPRGPKPGVMSRAGAILVDILALHAILLLIIKLQPAHVVSLGEGGPWVGLAVGFLYFTIGSSSITRGRTLGRILIRTRVSDAAGPDLPLHRAALRTLLLMWPLAVYIALNQMSEEAMSQEHFGPDAYRYVLGIALCAGWFAGNLFFSMIELHGRTLYDRLAGSVVTATDAQPAATQDFFVALRTTDDLPRRNRALVVLSACTLGLTGLVFYMLYVQTRDYNNEPPEKRAERERMQTVLHVPGFRFTFSPGSAADEVTSTSQGDAQTSPAAYRFVRRGPINPADLRANPEIMRMPDTIADFVREEIRKALADGKIKEDMPPKVRFRVGFAEVADLFFASAEFEVFSTSVVRNMSDLKGSKPKAATTVTTSTANALAADKATSAPAATDSFETTLSATKQSEPPTTATN
ncbi:MAG: RDD family protein [Candidatus Sumerlaeaceae bacterium]|nr:RDD family protein [Candidatus Sumerlaeaceae bacterium]